MKVIMTGVNGTLAPIFKKSLEDVGHQILAWDREKTSPDDLPACLAYLDEQKPDWICHLAMGAEAWCELFAKYAADNKIGYLFTSSAMVFDCEPNGPHKVTDERTAQGGYGSYKIACEDAILGVSNTSIIARIGWQIGTQRGGNQMLEALHSMMEKDEVIKASTTWIPAASFMEDTCQALIDLMHKNVPGIYHIDSNTQDKWNFFQLVNQLKKMYNTDWVVESCEDYVHDQRLLDDRVQIASFSEKFRIEGQDA